MMAIVFVIDDDASMRKSLKRLLDAACYKVELFTSASEFLTRSAHDLRAWSLMCECPS